MSNIVIADPHNLCRESLCTYIRHAEPNIFVHGFCDYAGLRHHLMNAKADLVLIDSNLSGWEKGNLGGVKIGMIVAMPDEEMLKDPFIHGVFPKSLSCKAFLGGIREILEGGTFFPSNDPANTVYDFMPLKRPPQDFSLTSREKEVLTHLVLGLSNKDIARALDLQVVTIKLHVRGICRKLRVTNRTQAALTAKENGWG